MINSQMTHESENITKIALEYHQTGAGAALATVIETWGSAPRPVGAQLAIKGDGTFMGSVSGGCVEGAVVAEALDALKTGKCCVLEYGVSDEQVFAVGLACGGTIRILVEPIGQGNGPSETMLQSLVKKQKSKTPVGYQVNLLDWSRSLISRADNPKRFLSDKSGVDGEILTVIHNPSLRLMVVGAVHIAQALVPMARIAGYGVHLIDPRDSFGSQSRFPADTIISDWPDAALAGLGIDTRTAIVTLTHDPKLDIPALMAALKSDAFYIGALGSQRTHAKRVDQLLTKGFDAERIARIHGPVGLNIGAATPAEIAVSILGELTQTLRQSDVD